MADDVFVRYRLDLKKLSEDQKKLESIILKQEKTIDSLGKKLESKIKNGTGKGVDAASKKLKFFEVNLKQLVPVLGAAFAAQKVIQFATEIAKLSLELDKGFKKVNTVAQLTDKQLESLQKRAINIGKETSIALDKIPDALFEIVSATGDVNLSMKIFEASTKAAQTGFSDLISTSKAGVNILNAVGKETTNINEVFDVLFKTQKEGVLTFEILSDVLPRILPTAKTLGISFQETAGALATLTKAGIDAVRASTVLDATFRDLANSSKAAQFEKLGVEIFDASGKTRKFTDIIEDLTVAFDGLTQEDKLKKLKQLGLEENAAKGIAVFTDNYETLKQVTDSVESSQGELNTQFEASQNGADKLAIAGNKITAAFVNLSDSNLLMNIGSGAVVMAGGFETAVKALSELNPLLLATPIAGLAVAKALIFGEEQMTSFEDALGTFESRQKKVNKANEEAVEVNVELARTVKDIKDEIKEKQTALDAASISDGESLRINTEIKDLQGELAIALGESTEAQKAATKAKEDAAKADKKAKEELAANNKKFKDQVEKDILSSNKRIEDLNAGLIQDEFDKQSEFLTIKAERAIEASDESLATDAQKAEEKLLIEETLLQDLTDLDTDFRAKRAATAEKAKKAEVELELETARKKQEILELHSQSLLNIGAIIGGQSFQQSKDFALAEIALSKGVAIAALVKDSQVAGITPIDKALIFAQGLAVITTGILQAQTVLNSEPAPGFKDGVIRLNGPGTHTSDSIPAFLSRDESVIKAKQSIKHEGALESIQADRFDDYVFKNYLPEMLKKKSGTTGENIAESVVLQEVLKFIENEKDKPIALNNKTLRRLQHTTISNAKEIADHLGDSAYYKERYK